MNVEIGQIVLYVLAALASLVFLAEKIFRYIRQHDLWQDKLPEEVWKAIESVLDALKKAAEVTRPIIKEALGVLYDVIAEEWPPLLNLVSREKFIEFFMNRLLMEIHALHDVGQYVEESASQQAGHKVEVNWPAYPNLWGSW